MDLSNINLEKMLSMQKELDERIIKDKGLEGQDLFPNTVLALQVELAEFANEGRWFKHWSNDQEPRVKAKCPHCKGKGFHEFYDAFEMFETQYSTEPCNYCEETGFVKNENPLLEEFVDGVHFFLSIAIQKGWQESLYIYEEAVEDLREEGIDGGLTGIFLEMNYFLSKCHMEGDKDPETDPFQRIANVTGVSRKAYLFKMAWFLFICIGLIGFNFTPKQIELAYMDKNAVNHQRQVDGY
jgi:dimeric dUTPase (all-alpha-NTP-PPase superfamily)